MHSRFLHHVHPSICSAVNFGPSMCVLSPAGSQRDLSRFVCLQFVAASVKSVSSGKFCLFEHIKDPEGSFGRRRSGATDRDLVLLLFVMSLMESKWH